MRTKEIRKAAEDIGASCLGASCVQFSSVNDIRFTEYLYKLLSAVLANHKSMITHLSSVDTTEVKGLRNKWLGADTVAAILCDALYVYKRFQKVLQGDAVTIFDVETFPDKCVEKIFENC